MQGFFERSQAGVAVIVAGGSLAVKKNQRLFHEPSLADFTRSGLNNLDMICPSEPPGSGSIVHVFSPAYGHHGCRHGGN